MQTPDPENTAAVEPASQSKPARKRTKAPKSVPTGQRGAALVSSEEVLAADPILIAPSRHRRDQIAEWILLRMKGMTNVEIAKHMGLSVHTLNSAISKASKEGWLKMESVADRLEYQIIPIVVDNVERMLMDGSEKMTIEAAKGLGLFKSHQAVKVENTSPNMVLAIKFENPDTPSITITEHAFLGAPKLPDA